MKTIFSCLLICFCLSSCNSHNNTNKKEITFTDTAIIDSSANKAINKKSITSILIDSAVHIYLDKKDSSKTLSGKLKGNHQPIKIYIEINSGDTLNAFIEPSEEHANIRLNQVVYPDGTADGPFGRDQKFALKKTGVYQLIIGNNLMAEGKTTTAFTLHLSVY